MRAQVLSAAQVTVAAPDRWTQPGSLIQCVLPLKGETHLFEGAVRSFEAVFQIAPVLGVCRRGLGRSAMHGKSWPNL